jgi:predicted metal-dependent peptidase
MGGWRRMVTTSYEALFKKIRINFLFNHPFLSVLALSIKTEFKQNRYSAFQTDGVTISIDSNKLHNYSDEQITYLYAHTLLHIVLKHPFRQQTREKELWNQSCDLVTNLILSTFTHVGVAPDDEMIDMDLKDKCVEEVYEILYKKQENEDDKAEEKEDLIETKTDKNGDLKAHTYSEDKRDLEDVPNQNDHQNDKEEVDGVIIKALSLVKKSSKAYQGLHIEIDTLMQPEISLEDRLKEYLVVSLFEKVSTYERPNKKFIHSGIYLPGYKKSKEYIELFVAVDSSSSVTLEEYQKFLGVVKEICESFYEYKIVVLPFDTTVREEYIMTFDSFNPMSSEKLTIPKSNGGTNFDAVLTYLQHSSDIRNDSLLIVLSDGEFSIGESLVSQTLFLISEKRNSKKFEKYGSVIQFNI